MSKLHRDNAGYVGCSAEETQDPYYSYNKLALPLSGDVNSVQREEVTFTVTVVSTGSGNKYVIDGVQQATVNLLQGNVYTFDQSHNSNSGHPLRLSYTANGTHAGGIEYTLGVTKHGTPGTSGAYTRIVVPFGLHDLNYYCFYHSGMGGAANVSSNPNMTTFGLPILKTTGAAGQTANSNPSSSGLEFGYDNADNSFDSSSTTLTKDTTGYTFNTWGGSQLASALGGNGTNSVQVIKATDGKVKAWFVSTDNTDRYFWTSDNGIHWRSKGSYYDTDGSTQVIVSRYLGWAAGSNSSTITVTAEDPQVAADPYAPNLVLAVPMNGSNGARSFADYSSAIKGSGIANAITIEGDTQIATSQSQFYGSSAYLDGSSDEGLTIANNPDLDLGTGDFTVEFWTYLTTIESTAFVGKFVSGNYGWIIQLVNATTFRFYSGNNGSLGSPYDFTGGTVLANKWHHVALTRHEGVVTMYLDGNSIGAASNRHDLTASTALVVGTNADSTDQTVNGFMSDLRIYKGVAKYRTPFPIGEFGHKAVTYIGNSGVKKIGPKSVSVGVTATGTGAVSGISSTYPLSGLFDGNSSTYLASSASNISSSPAILTVLFPAGNQPSYSSSVVVEVWSGSIDTVQVSINGGSYQSVAQNNWTQHTIATGSGTITEIKVSRQKSNTNAGAAEIRRIIVDGVELLDGDGSNILFSPGLVWIKEIDSTGDHHLFDTVRGATKALRSNEPDGEVTDTNELTAFNSDGFSLGNGGDVNANTTNTVAWMWDVGTVTNPVGDIWTPGATKYIGIKFATASGGTVVYGQTSGSDTVEVWTSSDNSNWTQQGSSQTITTQRSLTTSDQYVYIRNTSNALFSNWYAAASNGADGHYSSVTYPSGASWTGPGYTDHDFRDGGGAVIAAGSLNSSVYNQSHAITSNITGNLPATGNPLANWFNGQRANKLEPSGSGSLDFSSVSALQNFSGTLQFAVSAYSGSTSMKFVINASTDNLTFTTEALPSSSGGFPSQLLTIPVTSLSTLDFTSISGQSTQFWGMYLDGKLLVDSTATPTNIPSVASSVRASTENGFSIVRFTTTANGQQISHGLNSTPKWIIGKYLDGSSNWRVYHSSVGASKTLYLNSTSGESSDNDRITAVDSSTFTLGGAGLGTLGDSIAYCWSETAYSKFGSYTSSSNAAQTITTGFKPAFVLIKGTGSGGFEWVIYDSVRGGANHLTANNSNVENSPSGIGDITFEENGFSIPASGDNGNIRGGGTYVYMAFAESSANDDAYKAVGSSEVALNDLSSSAHAITNNGATFQSTVSKFYDGATEFNGSSSNLTIPASSDFDFGTGDFTIEMWAYLKAATSNMTLISSGNYYTVGSNGNWLLRRTNGSQITFASWDGQGSSENGGLSAVTNLYAWNHFALTRRANTVQVFVNGSPGGTMTVTKSLSDGGTNGLRIGHGNTNAHWNGYIQDVRVYKGIAKYTSSFSPPERSVQGTARRYPSGIYVVS